jgi:arylsulfatase A-like enzyme
MAHACDWLPTLAELCNVPLPQTQLDGLSLVEVLSSADAASPHKELAWNTKNQWSIRSGPWKLIHRVQTAADDQSLSPTDKQYFLVNLEEDVSESKNLAADHPEVVERLKQHFEATYSID